MGEIVCSQTECVCCLSQSRRGKARRLNRSELVDVHSNMENREDLVCSVYRTHIIWIMYGYLIIKKWN